MSGTGTIVTPGTRGGPPPPTLTLDMAAVAAAARPLMEAPQPPEPGVAPRWNGRERRRQDGVRRLSREFDALATTAVDPTEIVAGLEAHGMNDEMAREYGCRDLFDLAEKIFAVTPRVADRLPGKLANPWIERPVGHLVRGLSFSMPGLIFVAALRGTHGGIAAIAIALMIGWPISQVLAYLGYTLEGRHHPMGARALLLAGLVISVAVAVVFVPLAQWAGVPPAVARTASIEIAYLAAAAVIAVLGRDLLIIGVLAPSAGLAALVGLGVGGTRVGLLAPVVMLIAGLGAAGWLCRCVRWPHFAVVRAEIGRPELDQAALQASYGFIGAGLVTLPLLRSVSHASALMLLPLTWSMGMAEWQVLRLRRVAFDLLNQVLVISAFQRRVRNLLNQCSGWYLLALTVLSLPVLAVSLSLGEGVGPSLASLGAAWLLGLAFFMALVMSSLGAMARVVASLSAACLLGLVVILAVPASLANLAEVVAPLTACLVLGPQLLRRVGDPTSHM